MSECRYCKMEVTVRSIDLIDGYVICNSCVKFYHNSAAITARNIQVNRDKKLNELLKKWYEL